MDSRPEISFGDFPISRLYGLFTCDTIHLVEASRVNKSCILGLETYLVENSGSAFYPFIVYWFRVGTIIASI